jgi:tetratricopeptide (TPR) repeat protein
MFWDWLRTWGLANPFVWWVGFIVLWVAAFPFVRAFRIWRETRRFMAAQGRQLENPQNAEARYLLASIYAQGRRWSRAAVLVDDAVRVARESDLYDRKPSYRMLCLQGRVRLARRDEAGAAEAYREALGAASDRGHAEARFGLGRALAGSGDAAGALEQYREASDAMGSTLEFYFRCAQASAMLGDAAGVAGARDAFRRMAASLPPFAGKGRLRWRLAFLFFGVTRHWI